MLQDAGMSPLGWMVWTMFQISLVVVDPSEVECGSLTCPKPLGPLELMLDTRAKDLLNVECFDSMLVGDISMFL